MASTDIFTSIFIDTPIDIIGHNLLELIEMSERRYCNLTKGELSTNKRILIFFRDAKREEKEGSILVGKEKVEVERSIFRVRC